MAEEQESSSLTGEIETLRRPLRYYQEYDQLTGTFNKAAFCKKGSELLSASYDGLFDVVCIDIERFKLVNDIYGMKRGDSLLCHVARGLERKFGLGGGIIALNTIMKLMNNRFNILMDDYGRASRRLTCLKISMSTVLMIDMDMGFLRRRRAVIFSNRSCACVWRSG